MPLLGNVTRLELESRIASLALPGLIKRSSILEDTPGRLGKLGVSRLVNLRAIDLVNCIITFQGWPRNGLGAYHLALSNLARVMTRLFTRTFITLSPQSFSRLYYGYCKPIELGCSGADFLPSYRQ